MSINGDLEETVIKLHNILFPCLYATFLNQFIGMKDVKICFLKCRYIFLMLFLWLGNFKKVIFIELMLKHNSCG